MLECNVTLFRIPSAVPFTFVTNFCFIPFTLSIAFVHSSSVPCSVYRLLVTTDANNFFTGFNLFYIVNNRGLAVCFWPLSQIPQLPSKRSSMLVLYRIYLDLCVHLSASGMCVPLLMKTEYFIRQSLCVHFLYVSVQSLSPLSHCTSSLPVYYYFYSASQ